jgi:hypothetical protein
VSATHRLSFRLARELTSEDDALGQQVMKGLLSYIHSTRNQPRQDFSGLKDFLDYRAVDIASE